MDRRSCFPLIGLVLFAGLTLLPGTASAATGTAASLAMDHFFPKTGLALTYSYDDAGDTTGFVSRIKEIDTNKHKKTCTFPDGMENFSFYLEEEDRILETEAGWSIPNSEWASYPVIQGSNVVFKAVTPGTTWSNEYTTRDPWGNITREYNSFTFEGQENVEIQGKSIPAAKLSWHTISVAQEGQQGEWINASSTSRGEDWYVQGLGLVKRSFLTEDGSVSSGFSLTCIWDTVENKEVPVSNLTPSG